jgi:magnesium-transporting ATPase (P-type)
LELWVLLKDAASLPVIHVLAIDLGIDAIPSLALSREPVEAGIMQEPPRSVKERLFNRKVFLRSLYIGLIIAAGAMYGCLSAWSAGGWHLGMSLDPNDPVYLKGTTMIFAGIVVAQIGNVLACRTSKVSIFKTSVKSNKWIWLGITSQLSMISLIVYVPILQKFFGTLGLSIMDWAYLAFLAIIVILAEETRKWFARRTGK